jgi:hypothetical protein
LWDLFPDEDDPPSDSSSLDASETSGQLCAFLSEVAVTGVEGPRAMRLYGSMHGCDIMILVDSVSSHSFISSHMASQLSGVSPLVYSLSVRVANGASVVCDSQFNQIQWEVQGYSFHSDFKVMSLTHFDVILGYDWLEMFSPMKVHWKAKWMIIPYGQSYMLIQGILSLLLPGDVVQISQLAVDDEAVASVTDQVADDVVLPEIEQLLHSYADLFATQVSFPPPRECSHTILLIPGASSVNIRPYRYAPLLKNEIEHQVKQMLEAGLIQPSNNSYSSPVLLVKKKMVHTAFVSIIGT